MADDNPNKRRSAGDHDNIEDQSLPKRPNNAEANGVMPSVQNSPHLQDGSPTAMPCNDSQPAVVEHAQSTQPTGNFKLHVALPKQIMQKHDQLETACRELCSHINNMLPASTFEGQVNEFDLTLPSSYANCFNNNSQFLCQLLNQPIKKYPKSKVIRFPEMKLEILSELIKKLQDFITPATCTYMYDTVSLLITKLSGRGDSTYVCDVLKSLLCLLIINHKKFILIQSHLIHPT
jgi:hypothetical protein